MNNYRSLLNISIISGILHLFFFFISEIIFYKALQDSFSCPTWINSNFMLVYLPFLSLSTVFFIVKYYGFVLVSKVFTNQFLFFTVLLLIAFWTLSAVSTVLMMTFKDLSIVRYIMIFGYLPSSILYILFGIFVLPFYKKIGHAILILFAIDLIYGILPIIIPILGSSGKLKNDYLILTLKYMPEIILVAIETLVLYKFKLAETESNDSAIIA